MALAAIMSWYIVIGVLAAVGTVTISRARLSPRVEHVFFALLLIPVAAIYLAFLGYFGDAPAFRAEGSAVAAFVVLALLGLRLPVLLMLGYGLHGAWDLVHEIGVLLDSAPGASSPLTNIPLAYGVFCAAYDWYMVGYFSTRWTAWRE